MNIFIVTAFPTIFQGFFSESILKQAIKKNIINVEFIYLRDFAIDHHNTIDDEAYGGSSGMIYRIEPIYNALKFIKNNFDVKNAKKILTSARGKVFNQDIAKKLAKEKNLIFICGRYKDTDFRVNEYLVTDEYSIGDYILTGGEQAAIVMIDAIVRLIPGVVGKAESVETDSFFNGLLDCPRYTRPYNFNGMKVPDVLLSGDHKKIEKWQKYQSIKLTKERRPDLWKKYTPDTRELEIINEFESRRN